jgi:hypothetical protein
MNRIKKFAVVQDNPDSQIKCIKMKAFTKTKYGGPEILR